MTEQARFRVVSSKHNKDYVRILQPESLWAEEEVLFRQSIEMDVISIGPVSQVLVDALARQRQGENVTVELMFDVIINAL